MRWVLCFPLFQETCPWLIVTAVREALLRTSPASPGNCPIMWLCSQLIITPRNDHKPKLPQLCYSVIKLTLKNQTKKPNTQPDDTEQWFRVWALWSDDSAPLASGVPLARCPLCNSSSDCGLVLPHHF